MCLLHILSYLNLRLDRIPYLSGREERRPLRAALMASGWGLGPGLHPITEQGVSDCCLSDSFILVQFAGQGEDRDPDPLLG